MRRRRKKSFIVGRKERKSMGTKSAHMCISFKSLFIAFILFIITCILSSRFCLCSFKLLKIFAHYKQTYFFYLLFPVIALYSFTHFRIKRKKKRERSIWLSSLLGKKLIISFSGIFSLCWWNDFHITF